jgi:hypothetical protein
MVHDTETIHVTAGTDVGPLLERADRALLRVEKDGVFYRLVREDAVWSGYDPEKVRAVIQETAGSWSDLDTDALIERLYHAREEGSRPANRP